MCSMCNFFDIDSWNQIIMKQKMKTAVENVYLPDQIQVKEFIKIK